MLLGSVLPLGCVGRSAVAIDFADGVDEVHDELEDANEDANEDEQSQEPKGDALGRKIVTIDDAG